jgi:hypothetical protein
MSRSQASWELYERMIARLMADQLSTGLCVTPNARIKGGISGRQRQIDVLIDARHDTDNSRRIIIDAKQKKRKIDVKDVEAFRGMMEDVDATHGYLICASGHTKAAERRAQSAVSICLVPLDHIEDFDPTTWPRCLRMGCEHGRIFWDGYPEVSLGLMALNGGGQQSPIRKSFVHNVGKCDRCGKFHVLCATCDQILYVPEDDESDTGHQCACQLPWFWLASIEKDEMGRRSAELHLVMGEGNVETVDRRSL